MRSGLLGVLLVLSLVPAAQAAFEGPPVEKGVTRPVILVGNNWDGTTDIVDPETFERLDRINVVPDREERMKGLEPSTFCMASRRSSQLSYIRAGGKDHSVASLDSHRAPPSPSPSAASL